MIATLPPFLFLMYVNYGNVLSCTHLFTSTNAGTPIYVNYRAKCSHLR